MTPRTGSFRRGDGRPAPACALLPPIALLVLITTAVPEALAERASVDWSRARGDSVELLAHVDVTAPRAVAWQVLTDYDRMNRFVPGIRRSRRIAASAEGPMVEQVGVARVWFVGRRFSALFQMREQPPGQIFFRAVSGDLSGLRGTWSLAALRDERTRLTYRCRIVRPSALPRVLREWIVREEWLSRARAVGREVERRARARGLGVAG